MTSETLSIEAPGEVCLVEEKLPDLPDGGFMVATAHSGVSAGTELTYVKGTNPYLGASWDPALGLFLDGAPSVAYPVRGIGYMQVGLVVETRTRAVREGALVAMAYGHRTAYVADPMTDRFVELPDDLDPLLGIYVAHMGPICANGLLHAAHDLHGPAVRDLGDGVRGRRVAVVGAGVVGLLTACFAMYAGAAEVVVVDETPSRLEIAAALGAGTMDAAQDPAVELKRRWRHGPNDRGADVVFQCRGQARALALGLRLLRPPGHADRPGLLHRRRPRGAARGGVPPQRAHRALRPDRPGAARSRARLGQGAPVARDHRAAAAARPGTTPARGHRSGRIRRSATSHDRARGRTAAVRSGRTLRRGRG
ncbi:zinc-binding dehydrogenase [Nonomuraea salmonea]|uniref:zinc-binding dehydrogenase n=1 Tax=Nonomuraea salmonea TaxID=46181 RepID=UPI0031E7C3EF